jgi:2-haloacid dehalogenase
VEGLNILRSRFACATLSNGNMALLVNMAKHAGLSWDCVLSAELARQYKPEPVVYQYAMELLGVQPDEALMVAAHHRDLYAAQKVGMRTAFVYRPLEVGPGWTADSPDPIFDFNAADFFELAEQLNTGG